MFDVGFQELFLIFVIGLLILGPERLPRVASQLGRWVGRARRTANQLRHQLEREIALEEMTRSQQRRKKPSDTDDRPSSKSSSESGGEGAQSDTAGDAGRGADDGGPGQGAEQARSADAAAHESQGAAASEAAVPIDSARGAARG
jgi:sec-independent protein translocase protein TatB